MSVFFTKMHGLGNDFMVVNAISQKVAFTPQQIRNLSQRDTGVGFDQCLLVESSRTPGIDFFYRIFNADGHEVGQCGNGARCLARFLHHYGLTKKQTITVATHTTEMTLVLNADHSVTVDLGRPHLNPPQIPLTALQQSILYSLPLSREETCEIHAINVGNPHAVMVLPDLNQVDVARLGPLISKHTLFPEQTNAGFMQIISKQHVQLRVYERGSGETKACGSGAVAAAAIGRLYHHLDENITVSLAGGDLRVSWPDVNGSIFLTGPATFVYEGTLCAL